MLSLEIATQLLENFRFQLDILEPRPHPTAALHDRRTVSFEAAGAGSVLSEME
jgi:hypothetical protein